MLKIKKIFNQREKFYAYLWRRFNKSKYKEIGKIHLRNNKTATMTIVRPPVRFGEVKTKGLYYDFKEKPQIKQSWINGGFFVFNKNIFKFLGSGNEMLEKTPIEKLSKKKELLGFKHLGFWQCMDTPRDKEYLQNLLKIKKAPWKN